MGPGGGFPGGPMQDPEVRERLDREMNLRRQVGELAHEYRSAGAKEKEAAKAELKKVLGKLFDVETSNQEQRAKKLQEESVRIQEDISKARANRDKVVGRRLEQMTDADGWEW